MHKYFIGEPLPPHLSPFIKEERRVGDYVPPEEKEMLGLNAKKDVLDQDKQEESDEEEAEEEEAEGSGSEEESDDDQEEEEETEVEKEEVKKMKVSYLQYGNKPFRFSALNFMRVWQTNRSKHALVFLAVLGNILRSSVNYIQILDLQH